MHWIRQNGYATLVRKAYLVRMQIIVDEERRILTSPVTPTKAAIHGISFRTLCLPMLGLKWQQKSQVEEQIIKKGVNHAAL